VLPLGLGDIEDITNDYVRHGTTTLFAAVDMADGCVPRQYKSQHRHQEYPTFLRHAESQMPDNLDVYLICDLYLLEQSGRARARICHQSGHSPRLHRFRARR
jgi:hypothetical protein